MQGPLFLGRVLYRDVRRCILRYLTEYDFELLLMAHGCPRTFGPTDLSFLRHCAEHDYANLLQWNDTILVGFMVIDTAARAGSFQVLRHLQSTFDVSDFQIIALNAAEYDHLEILQWIEPFILKSGSRDNLMNRAISGGHIRCMDYLYRKLCFPTGSYFHWHLAAQKGFLHCLEWAEKHGYCINVSDCCSNAGSLPVLQWCLDRGVNPLEPFGPFVVGVDLHHAIDNGNLDVVHFLVARGCALQSSYMSRAAKSNHVPILQCLFNADCPFDESVCQMAALCGNLEAFEWAVDHGMPRTAIACETAACHGNIEILRAARKRNYPMELDKMLQVAEETKRKSVCRLIKSWME